MFLAEIKDVDFLLLFELLLIYLYYTNCDWTVIYQLNTDEIIWYSFWL